MGVQAAYTILTVDNAVLDFEFLPCADDFCSPSSVQLLRGLHHNVKAGDNALYQGSVTNFLQKDASAGVIQASLQRFDKEFVVGLVQ